MIQHVWQQACKSRAARVVIATDDKRIEEAAIAFGAEVCMTRDDHISGTDRLQEVAQTLDLADEQIIVNVQGDEPLIPPEVINQVATNLANSSTAGVATLCEPLSSVVDFVNPNTVKVVSDAMGNALYFSRAPIPFPRDKSLGSDNSLPENARRHIGIYAYKVVSINQFVHWTIAPLERLESLEQLRFLANGIAIHVADACATVPGGVDTEDDLQEIINSL
jgi:3-deoxy-manno-octulosonate cytidylyltransferase (CMP-KDO synthetase)